MWRARVHSWEYRLAGAMGWWKGRWLGDGEGEVEVGGSIGILDTASLYIAEDIVMRVRVKMEMEVETHGVDMRRGVVIAAQHSWATAMTQSDS